MNLARDEIKVERHQIFRSIRAIACSLCKYSKLTKKETKIFLFKMCSWNIVYLRIIAPKIFSSLLSQIWNSPIFLLILLVDLKYALMIETNSYILSYSFNSIYTIHKLETHRILTSNIQKQPPRDVPKKRCSENMPQIYNFIEIALRHGCSPVNRLLL